MARTESKTTKFERDARRIFCEVFKRQFPATADVDRLAFEIERIVREQTAGLADELAASKIKVQSLSRRLAEFGYDGPMEVGQHKRKLPRLRAQAERMNR